MFVEMVVSVVVGLIAYNFIVVLFEVMVGRKNQDTAEIVEGEFDDLSEKTSAITVHMYLEQDEDFRLYLKDNDIFVCQGKDLEDLNKQFRLRFPYNVGLVEYGSGPNLVFGNFDANVDVEYDVK
jgi:hypothetical protein